MFNSGDHVECKLVMHDSSPQAPEITKVDAKVVQFILAKKARSVLSMSYAFFSTHAYLGIRKFRFAKGRGVR